MTPDFKAALVAHRPALLRHCYRMLGSRADAEDLVQDTLERAWKARASYEGTAPLQRWLHTIATNACLNALKTRRRRALPQLERDPAGDTYTLGETETERWITPAPDAALFPDPADAVESRETVALAFVALMQRMPPRQRAALLLTDVLGFAASETAEALGLSVASVNSAIHRGREAVARAEARADEPPPDTLQAFVSAWEKRDLDGLVALLRRDVTLAMPPHAVWFRGVDAVTAFFQTPQFSAFWTRVHRVATTRANGLPAVAFWRTLYDGVHARHSILVTRFVGGRVAEMTCFVGATYFDGFDLEVERDRTVSAASVVLNEKGDRP